MGIFGIFKKKEKRIDENTQNVFIQKPEKEVVLHGNVSAEVIDINPKTVEMLHRSFIAFDVETTGLNLTQIRESEIEGLLFSAEQRIKDNIEIEKAKRRSIEEKQRAKEEKKIIKELEKQKKNIDNSEKIEFENPNVKRTGRGILQLNDDGTIINEYETIASAVRETGVNSKSIRDAANGVQKHAGGFCWKYRDEDLESKVK